MVPPWCSFPKGLLVLGRMDHMPKLPPGIAQNKTWSAGGAHGDISPCVLVCRSTRDNRNVVKRFFLDRHCVLAWHPMLYNL